MTEVTHDPTLEAIQHNSSHPLVIQFKAFRKRVFARYQVTLSKVVDHGLANYDGFTPFVMDAMKTRLALNYEPTADNLKKARRSITAYTLAAARFIKELPMVDGARSTFERQMKAAGRTPWGAS